MTVYQMNQQNNNIDSLFLSEMLYMYDRKSKTLIWKKDVSISERLDAALFSKDRLFGTSIPIWSK